MAEERPQILVVDDEESLLFLMKRLLSARYDVAVAPQGETALQALEEAPGRIRLVLLDVTMPEMDGPAFLRRVRKTHPGLPVLAMSGLPEEAVRSLFKDSPPDAYLRKPVRLADITATVERLLIPVGA